MRGLVSIVAAFAVTACTGKDGPKPVLSSVQPSPVCVAQHDVNLTLSGSGFSPAVTHGLTGSPQVVLPAVTIGSTAIDPNNVRDPDTSGTELLVTVPAASVDPGTYDVTVTNPNNHSSTLSGGLQVDPAPTITAVMPTAGNVGQMVMVTLTGTGFQPTMVVTLDATPPVTGTNLTVSAGGTSATVTFDLTGVKAGTYGISVSIDNAECVATLPNAFTVRDLEFTITGIDPPFGCMCDPTTSVTITSNGGFSSTPVVTMVKHGTTTPVYTLQRVAFVDTNTITGAVPTGTMTLGTYDVTITDPPSDGRTGTLASAFRVVQLPIPTIEQIVPDRGPPGAANFQIDIYGENFRSPGKVELLDRTGTTVATDTAPTVSSPTHEVAHLTLPNTEDAYLVRLWDMDEMTYSTFSAFIVGAEGASGNLHTFAATSTLNTGRRMLGGVSARDDLGNRFVYAIAGDTGGATPTVLDSVEVAQLSKFGALGGWHLEKAANALVRKLDAPAAVAVELPNATDPFGPPTKTYVYVVGGRDDAGTVRGEVERAMVLRNADAPKVADPVAATGGTLAAGTWYYKVSAICSSTNLDNPSGETLPSDEQIITLDSAHTAVTLTWTAVATTECTASGYNVYRTKDVNGTSQQELLIATPGNVLTYTDTGASAGTETPLPPGSLGVWSTEAIALGTARWGHQAAVIADGGGGAGGLGGLYVLGGKSNATTGYLASVEYAPIDVTGHLTGATFSTTGTTAMPAALAFFSLVVETATTVKGYAGATPRIYTLGGVGSAIGGTSNEIQTSTVAAGGGNGAWADGFMNGSLLNSVGGNMAVISSNKLWSVGGARMFNNTTQVFSNVTGGGDDISFNTSGDLVAPTNSAANLLPAPRALGVPITGAGFIYFVGGTSDGTDATNTTYQTF